MHMTAELMQDMTSSTPQMTSPTVVDCRQPNSIPLARGEKKKPCSWPVQRCGHASGKVLVVLNKSLTRLTSLHKTP